MSGAEFQWDALHMIPIANKLQVILMFVRKYWFKFLFSQKSHIFCSKIVSHMQAIKLHKLTYGSKASIRKLLIYSENRRKNSNT